MQNPSLTTIPELLIQIFEQDLPLRDLISATHVCQQWRALVPIIASPTRLRLLGLAFSDVNSPHTIPIGVRITYVNDIETTHGVVIPEPYRTILTEWPSSQPPPGMHWPHAVRFSASGFCFCPRHMHEDPDVCLCEDQVRNVEITMFKDIFVAVVEEGLVPVGREFSWELFKNPARLHTDEQNAQTMRFIRAQPATAAVWNTSRQWASFKFRVLQLSRYYVRASKGTSDGTFVMMLDGPTRGQVHGWSSSGSSWYDGFEAESFWDWIYSEWDRDASAAAAFGESEDGGSDYESE